MHRFNLPFDISRIATAVTSSTGDAFSFELSNPAQAAFADRTSQRERR